MASTADCIMRQMVLDIGLAPEPTLDVFLGAANGAVLARLRALVAGQTLAPVYLWGEPGTGKSHLLRAVRAALMEQGAAVGWLDARAIRTTPFEPSWEAVCIDDVDALDAGQQHLAFGWLIHALAPAEYGGCAVLAAGRVPPTDLPVRADLASRLAWGDIFELHLPTDDERRVALHEAAKSRGFLLTERVSSYLLTHFARDLGSQMQLLQQLDRFSLQEQRAITVPLLKAMLDGRAKASPLSSD